MPPEENKKAVQRMLDAFNTGDLAIVDQLMAPTHKDLTPFPGASGDPDGMKRQIRHLRQAFPDVKFTIEDITAEGETVAFRWKMVGTQRGSLLGHGPTNKVVEHHGNDFVKFAGGKMVEHRSSDNLRELLHALGHEPKFQPGRDPDLSAGTKGKGRMEDLPQGSSVRP